jgi:hypothetical protein
LELEGGTNVGGGPPGAGPFLLSGCPLGGKGGKLLPGGILGPALGGKGATWESVKAQIEDECPLTHSTRWRTHHSIWRQEGWRVTTRSKWNTRLRYL